MPAPFVFDSHVDTLQLALDMGIDLTEGSPGHLDLGRAKEGGLGAVVMTAWVHPKYCQAGQGGARARADLLFDELDRFAMSAAREARIVRTQQDWLNARESGQLALLAGMEGGHPLEEREDLLEHFFDRGLRVLTLVWNNHLPWVRSCEPNAPDGIPDGLSPFGCELVERMNELGIVVDLSHSGKRSFYDALEATGKPVIASHSACSALHDHQRNLDDDQLRALALNGGVVGVPFLPSFLDGEAQAEAARLRSEAGYRDLRAASAAELEVLRTAHMREVMAPLKIERLVDHIEHIARVAGVEHVGLGSDFDGITTTVAGLEDAAGYPNLIEPLRVRGFSGDEIEAICGLNMERVLLASLPQA